MTKRVYEGLTPEAMAHVYGHENPLQGVLKIKAEPDTKLIIGLPLRQPTGFHTYPVVEWEVCLDNAMVVLPRTKQYGDGTDYAVKTGLAAIQMPDRNSVIIKGAAVPLNLMESTLEHHAKVEHETWEEHATWLKAHPKPAPTPSVKYCLGQPRTFTNEQIINAYKQALGREVTPWGDKPLDPNVVRICCAWLEAQRTIKQSTTCAYKVKPCIEAWCGAYVDQASVTAAAILLGLRREGFNLNINKRFVFPHISRIADNPWAFHGNGKDLKGGMPNLGSIDNHNYSKNIDSLNDRLSLRDRIKAHGEAAKRIILAREAEVL